MAKDKSLIHPERKKWMKTGDPEINELLPKLSPKEKSYLELITSDAYADLVKRIEHYTGLKADAANLPSLLGLLMQALQQLQAIEKKYRTSLEDLAISAVLTLPEFEMVYDAIESGQLKLDVRLGAVEEGTLMPDQAEAENADTEELEQANMDLADAFDNLTDAKLKRRFANMLMQGHATQKLYLFNILKDDLDEIDENLINLYGIIATVAQIGYWATPPGFEQLAVQAQETRAGSEEVIFEDEVYTIKVRAISFPFVIHELVKGIYEWLSVETEDREVDSLAKESEDIIVGTELAKVILSYLDKDSMHLLPLAHRKILELPVKSIRDVILKNDAGKGVMQEIIDAAKEEWKEYKESANESVQINEARKINFTFDKVDFVVDFERVKSSVRLVINSKPFYMDNETADYFRNADGQFDDDSIIDMALDILSNLDDAAFDELRKPQE